MKMRNESPSTVGRFIQFLETGSYQQPDDSLCTHLRMLVFAGKYEVPRLAAYARRRAGKALERILAEGKGVEGEGDKSMWDWICGEVLEQVHEEGEKTVLREVLGRLVAPYVWRASGEEW
jgi:hypothetical protein